MPETEQGLMTADELFELPEDGWSYELVEGRLRRMAPTGAQHGRVVTNLMRALDRFVEEHELGALYVGETGFVLSPAGGPDTVLALDIAFVSARRAPEPDFERFPRLAPDLVVEVVSPSQSRAELGAKARQWLQAGVRFVWVAVPRQQVIEVWSGEGRPRVLSAEEELSGEDVLPGFSQPVRDIFP